MSTFTADRMIARNCSCAWNCGRDSEYGVRSRGVLVGLCFYCKLNFLAVCDPPPEVVELLWCPRQWLCRADLGRAGGGAECEDCGRELRDHEADADHPYMTVLCNGGLVKL